MKKEESEKLLAVPEVVEEIKRHLWIESEKAGHDIGYDAAARDWLAHYAKAWIAHHGSPKGVKKTAAKPKATKRRAKSYNAA